MEVRAALSARRRTQLNAKRQGIAPAYHPRTTMTYPQYQQPQGYAPQAPYQPAQQPYAQPQQYAPQAPYQPTQQPQPPVGGVGLPITAPPLATGGSSGGGAWPKMRHLQGCTIIFEPIRVDEARTATVKINGVTQQVPQPEAYYNLIVVDSPAGKIQYGDSLDASDPKPLAWERETPCRFTGINDYGFGPVQEVRNALAAGELARVGVVERGTQGNKPYLITKPDKMVGGGDRPDGADRFGRAGQVWAAVYGSLHGGAPWTNPEPRSLLQAPAQQPQQVTYGPPSAQPQYAQPQPQPQAQAYGIQPQTATAVMTPPAPQPPQGYAYGQPQEPYATPYAAANPGHGPYGDGPGGYAVAQPAPQPQIQQTHGTGNPAFDAWLATLPADQRAGYLAQQGGAAASAPPAPGQGPGI